MASALIHLAIANEVNKKLKKDKTKFLIGSIAPDLSKQIGQTKEKSHFLKENEVIPNLDWFLIRYKTKLSDDFVLGYYVHLYTDYLWFKYFLPEVFDRNKNMIKKLDGTLVKCTKKEYLYYIYNDYTNINIKLLDGYDLDLKIFYNEIPKIENIIQEIPMNQLKVIIDKIGIIIENSKETKDYVFDIENIKKFISLSTELILSNIEELMENK